MPWNDQTGGPQDDKGKPGGGPWGSGPRQPWGEPPRRPRGPPPGGDIEDFFRRMRERMGAGRGGGGRAGDGDGGGRRVNLLGAGAILLAAVWAASGVYVVDAGEQAVIRQFGRLHETRGSGLHYHLPAPIETRTIVNVQAQRRMEIPQNQEEGSTDRLMITGDRNIVDISFVVLWSVSDAEDFVVNVDDPEAAVRAVAESAMREVVGQRALQDVITTDRAAVESAVETLLQNILNSYEAGVLVQSVQLQSAVAPQQVIAAFDDVVRAGQDRQTAINQALQYRNERVPQARGEAAREVERANAYRQQVVREANGEASRFNAIYEQYRRAPRVTRERLYLETMERVYRDADTIIIDERVGVTPYLPLQELRRNQTQRQAAPPAAPQAAPPRAEQ
jgi:membrane protease subunit HflK